MNHSRPKTEQNISKSQKNSGKFSKTAPRPMSILTYKRPKTDLLSNTLSNFGKDAPKIAIGCSRPVPVFPPANPGPGAYSPMEPGISRKIYHKISKTEEKPRKQPTSDIDFINYRVFPEIKPTTISPTVHQDFYDVDESIPGPEYLPPDTSLTKTHKILPRREIKAPNEKVPGPGFYDPIYEQPKRFFFTSWAFRPPELPPKPQTPGPGEYNPRDDAMLSVMPRWSIGKKSRLRKRRKNDPPEVPKGMMIGIDQFLVQIDPSLDENESLRYIAAHPEMKEIVREFMAEVIDQKPEDPLKFIYDYFFELKKNR